MVIFLKMKSNLKNMKNKKINLGGYIGLVAILVVTLVAVLWMLYLWRQNIIGGLNINISGNEEIKTEQPKDMTEQLDDLRGDIKNIQDKKDQEIFDAMENK